MSLRAGRFRMPSPGRALMTLIVANMAIAYASASMASASTSLGDLKPPLPRFHVTNSDDQERDDGITRLGCLNMTLMAVNPATASGTFVINGSAEESRPQVWPGTAVAPGAATWSSPPAKFAEHAAAAISVATLYGNATADGLTPGEGGFRLTLVVDGTTRQTFLLNCPSAPAPDPTPTPAPTAPATATPAPTDVPTPPATATPTAAPPTADETAPPSATPSPTATPEPTATAKPTATPSATSTPAPATPAPTATPTPLAPPSAAPTSPSPSNPPAATVVAPPAAPPSPPPSTAAPTPPPSFVESVTPRILQVAPIVTSTRQSTSSGPGSLGGGGPMQFWPALAALDVIALVGIAAAQGAHALPVLGKLL